MSRLAAERWRRHWGLAGASCGLLFLLLTILVALRLLAPLDLLLSLATDAIASRPLSIATSALSLLGNAEVSLPVALITAAVLWRRGRLYWWLPLLALVGVLIELALKEVIAQPNPPFDRFISLLPFSGVSVRTPGAFPSGHSLRTWIVYGFPGLLGLRHGRPWWARGAGLLGVLLALLIGPSMIYLGAHWPSAVLGGWLLAAALLCAGWAVAGGEGRSRGT